MSKVTKGNGNVFADLDLPESDELLAKAELTRQIFNIIKHRKLTQKVAAKLLGVAQPDVSNLMNGRFTGFSTERLFHLLNALDRDVDIIVRRKPDGQKIARVSVVSG
jgi:predicted XRE-type DNA-binding protein